MIRLSLKRLHHLRTSVLLSALGTGATGFFPWSGEETYYCQGNAVVSIKLPAQMMMDRTALSQFQHIVMNYH